MGACPEGDIKAAEAVLEIIDRKIWLLADDRAGARIKRLKIVLSRLRIMKRPAAFFLIAAANAARAGSSVRQIAGVSFPYTRLSGLGG